MKHAAAGSLEEAMDLERVPLENGQLFLNTGCKCAEHVRNFVAARQYLDESRLQLLGQTYKAKVSKVLLGEDTPCVLKEMAVSWAKNPWKKAENAFRYRFRPRFLRTLKVALLARKAGISCYEPYAYWTDAREGLHIYFCVSLLKAMLCRTNGWMANTCRKRPRLSLQNLGKWAKSGDGSVKLAWQMRT